MNKQRMIKMLRKYVSTLRYLKGSISCELLDLEEKTSCDLQDLFDGLHIAIQDDFDQFIETVEHDIETLKKSALTEEPS